MPKGQRVEVNKGDRFGRLVIRKELPKRGSQRQFLCLCDCGNKTKVFLVALRRENGTRSCGCYAAEQASIRNKKHGYYRHPLYGVHGLIYSRCYNLDDAAYENYGGRGIGMCRKWREDKIAFIEWCLANGWEHGLDIDRKDNDKGYSPKNCRFVTRQVNNDNRRSTIKVRIKGEEMTLMAATQKYKVVNYYTARARIKRGWKPKDAVLEPI